MEVVPPARIPANTVVAHVFCLFTGRRNRDVHVLAGKPVRTYVDGFSDENSRGSCAQNISALREQHVCIFPTEEANVLVRPGPRMAEVARIMAHCLVSKAPTKGSGAKA